MQNANGQDNGLVAAFAKMKEELTELKKNKEKEGRLREKEILFKAREMMRAHDVHGRQRRQVPRDRRQAEKKQWNIRQRAKMGGDTEKENEHERVLPLEGRTLQIRDRMHILSCRARRKSTTRREKTSGKMLRLAGRIL